MGEWYLSRWLTCRREGQLPAGKRGLLLVDLEPSLTCTSLGGVGSRVSLRQHHVKVLQTIVSNGLLAMFDD